MIVRNSRSIIFSWDHPNLTSVDGSIVVTGYVVERSDTAQTSIISTNPIIRISGLAPYQLYQISVKAVFTGNNTGQKVFIQTETMEEGMCVSIEIIYLCRTLKLFLVQLLALTLLL